MSEHYVVADVLINSVEKLSPSLSTSSSPSVRRRKKTKHKHLSRKVNPAPCQVIGFNYENWRSITCWRIFEILLRVIYVFTSSAQKRLHSRYSQTVCLIKGNCLWISEKQIFLEWCFSLFFKTSMEQCEGFCLNQLAVRVRC